MRSHPTHSAEGRAVILALVRDPRVLSEALRAMARRAARRHQDVQMAWADWRQDRAELDAMRQRARDIRDQWADHLDQSLANAARHILGDDLDDELALRAGDEAEHRS